MQVRIRRQVNVASFQLVEQVRQIEETIVPLNVRVHTEALRQGHQAFAVGFAVSGDKVRMRRADNSVNHIRMIAHDAGEGFNGMLQPLAGAEQPERHQHRPPFQAKALLESCLPSERPVGCAVFDHVDHRRRRSIHARKDVAGMFGHHHDARGARDQVQHDPALHVGRFSENRVKGEHERRGNLIGKIADHLAALAAKNSELVLDPDGVHAAVVDLLRGGAVRGWIVRRDHAGCTAVLHRLRGIVDHIHIESEPRTKRLQGLRNVGGERGNPAPARRVAAHKCQPERIRLNAHRHTSCRNRKRGHLFEAGKIGPYGKGRCWHGRTLFRR